MPSHANGVTFNISVETALNWMLIKSKKENNTSPLHQEHKQPLWMEEDLGTTQTQSHLEALALSQLRLQKKSRIFNPFVIIVYSLKKRVNWSLSTVANLGKEESGCCEKIAFMGRAVISNIKNRFYFFWFSIVVVLRRDGSWRKVKIRVNVWTIH